MYIRKNRFRSSDILASRKLAADLPTASTDLEHDSFPLPHLHLPTHLHRQLCRHPSKTDEKGAVAGVFIFLLALLFAGVISLYTVFGTVVPPNYIGVRRNYFSFYVLNEGFSPIGLKPGLHLKFPWVSDIFLLPRGFQFINLNSDVQKADLDVSSLEVATKDGSKVNNDATLVVRLFDRPGEGIDTPPVPAPRPDPSAPDISVPLVEKKKRKHGGPASLITSFGDSRTTQLHRVVQSAEGELLRFLGQLSTSEFYNPALREWAAIQAQDAINYDINPRGIELWATLIRRYRYLNPEIDNQIFAKNLNTQTEKLRAASVRFEEATNEVRNTEAQWHAKIRDKQVQAENYQRRADADARFLQESRASDGEREFKLRQAEITAQKSQLLAELKGADVYVARDMVPVLKTLTGGIVSGLDPYDVDAWVQRLTGQGPSGRGIGGAQ